MPDALTKYDFYRGPQRLAELWGLRRDRLKLVCALSTHRLGWELRLGAGTNFTRSQVCKSQSEVAEVADKWKAEALRQGWTEPAPTPSEPVAGE
jgi:hypothetical protein